MAKAIFVTAFPPETSLPPMQARAGGVQLHFTENGVLKGGYSCLGYVPQAPTCLVLVEASPAAIAAMQVDPAYLFVEEVVEDAGPE